MECPAETLELLEKLQAMDFTILNLKRTFETLPQRQAILKARQGLMDVRERKVSADELVAKAQAKVDDVLAEDAQQAQKEEEIKKLLQDKSAGYREVEAMNKQLASVAKRRETLNHHLNGYKAELAKVKAVADKIDSAIASLEAKEAQEVESFRAQGTDLRERIAKAEKERAAFAPQLPASLLALYEKTAIRCGGVGVSHLKGDSCTVCRGKIDEARLHQCRKEAPLSTCPLCRRLLIVDK
ncbi:MAG: hypothetical protein IKF96_03095 [Eggerthellaceae bacterium]|nr:hypothetical protein [Eggerthellaceae bacterium]